MVLALPAPWDPGTGFPAQLGMTPKETETSLVPIGSWLISLISIMSCCQILVSQVIFPSFLLYSHQPMGFPRDPGSPPQSSSGTSLGIEHPNHSLRI